MKLSEYSDEDLIEEIRHRGLKIEVLPIDYHENGSWVTYIRIGGVRFDISK